MKFLGRISALLIASVFFFSCTSSKKISVNEISIEEILQNTMSNFEKINSYSGNGRMKVDLKNISASFKFFITVKKPSRVLIDLYGPLGFELGSVYLNGDSIFILNSIQNQIITTNFSSDKLKKLNVFGVDKDLIYSFLFCYFDQKSIVKDSVIVLNTKNQFHLIKFVGDKKLEFTYDKIWRNLNKVRVYEDKENPLFELNYSDIKNYDEIIFPEKIELLNLKTKESILLFFEKLNFNETENEINFDLPEDVEIIKW